MTHEDTAFFDRSSVVFTPKSIPTLADVRDRVSEEWSGTRKRDCISALTTLARANGKDLGSIPATTDAVRKILTDNNAVQLGLSERRWQNIRSAVAAAARAFGATRYESTKQIPINSEWSALLARIETKHHRHGLLRLARYCSEMQISPTALDQKALLGFYQSLVAEELLKDPEKKLKHTIACWNMCHRRVTSWPDLRLSSPFERNVIVLALDAFPQSFQDDLERWRNRLLDPDLMDPAAPPHPLKAITVDNKAAMILRFASALVHREILPIDTITDLSALVTDIEAFKQGLRFFLDRFDGKPNGYVAKMADCLRGVARHYVQVPEDGLEAMEAICKRLRPPRNEGLKAKNRARLAQFDDPDNVRRLLMYPAQEAERGRRHKNPYRAAKCFERAVAVALLIATAIRIKNLRTIDLETDLTFVDGRCFLSIPGDRVKNGMDLNFELPVDVATLLQEYLQTYRPRLPGSDGPFLFPARNGEPRPHSTLANDMKASLLKRTGLVMNPHLFRHATAKIVVERDPGLAFALSRHLGHKHINMTMQAYLGTEGRAAARSIDRVLKEALRNPDNREV